MFFINLNRIKFIPLIVGLCILLLPLSLWAQTAEESLIVEVKHRPANADRNAKIEEVLNKAAVIALEHSGLKVAVSQESPEEFSPELKITCRYLEQQDKLKLEYRLQVAATGKEIAEVQVEASLSHFLDRAVSNAVKELLHKGQNEIDQIAQAKQKQAAADTQKRESAVAVEERDTSTKPEDKLKTEQEIRSGRRPWRVEAEAKVSGAYMLSQTSEYLPYGLLVEGRFTYPLVQGEQMAWRLGGSLGMVRFFSADDHKAEYIKTLVPLALVSELRLKKAVLNRNNDWVFRFWWTAGAALRPPYEDEMVDELLAPAFPYANIGIGTQIPLGSDRLCLSTGFSGMGLFHLYEESDGGEVKIEKVLGINIDLGIVWRM